MDEGANAGTCSAGSCTKCGGVSCRAEGAGGLYVNIMLESLNLWKSIYKGGEERLKIYTAKNAKHLSSLFQESEHTYAISWYSKLSL